MQSRLVEASLGWLKVSVHETVVTARPLSCCPHRRQVSEAENFDESCTGAD